MSIIWWFAWKFWLCWPISCCSSFHAWIFHVSDWRRMHANTSMSAQTYTIANTHVSTHTSKFFIFPCVCIYIQSVRRFHSVSFSSATLSYTYFLKKASAKKWTCKHTQLFRVSLPAGKFRNWTNIILCSPQVCSLDLVCHSGTWFAWMQNHQLPHLSVDVTPMLPPS